MGHKLTLPTLPALPGEKWLIPSLHPSCTTSLSPLLGWLEVRRAVQNVLRVWLWGAGIAQTSQTPGCATKPPGHLLSPSPIESNASSLGTITQPEQGLLDSYCNSKKKKHPKISHILQSWYSGCQ